VCINVAAALILVQAFRGIRLDGTRVPEDEDDDVRREDQAADASGDQERTA
jgi:signal peptidase II